MYVGVVAKHEGADGFGTLIVYNTEQAPFNVVVNDRAEVRGVEVVLNKALFSAPFV